MASIMLSRRGCRSEQAQDHLTGYLTLGSQNRAYEPQHIIDELTSARSMNHTTYVCCPDAVTAAYQRLDCLLAPESLPQNRRPAFELCAHSNILYCTAAIKSGRAVLLSSRSGRSRDLRAKPPKDAFLDHRAQLRWIVVPVRTPSTRM